MCCFFKGEEVYRCILIQIMKNTCGIGERKWKGGGVKMYIIDSEYEEKHIVEKI